MEWLKQADVQRLLGVFEQAGEELRFVGGCVRDTLLGKALTDLDAATPARPERVMELLENAHIRAIPTGIAHGTITALIEGRPIEITTLRKDVETDGRHARVAFTDDWEEDAKRRDFTMNALYLGANGTITDYFSGLDDVKAGRVVFIGDARERIREDYLRILRFFRFSATVGKGAMNAEALAACAELKEGINQLSGERIQHEMFKLLASDHSAVSLMEMQQTGILPFIIITPTHAIEAVQKLDAEHVKPLLKLAALTSDLDEVAKRWKLSSKQTKQLEQWLDDAADITPDLDEATQKRLLRKLGKESYQEIVMLAWAQASHGWDYQALLGFIDWEAPLFPITGSDLQALGIAPGKALGDKLKQLEAKWELSGYRLSKAELLETL